MCFCLLEIPVLGAEVKSEPSSRSETQKSLRFGHIFRASLLEVIHCAVLVCKQRELAC